MSHNRYIQITTLILLLTLYTLTAPTDDFGSAMGLYLKGDYPAAMKEFTMLAGQGDTDAQFVLGDMYAQGQGVAQDNVQAYKWYAIASQNGAQGAPAVRDALQKKMRPEDVKKAQQLAQEWRPVATVSPSGAGTAPQSPAGAPASAPTSSSGGGFFKNIARTATGLGGSPGAASNTSTSVSGIRGLDAEGLRAASPDMNALKIMEGYVSSPSDATGFAQNARLVAQTVPYIEIQTEGASTQPAAPKSFGSH